MDRIEPGAAAAPADRAVAADDESLVVGPVPRDDPLIVDLAWLSRRIDRPEAALDTRAPAGEHVDNPHLPPAGGRPHLAAVLIALATAADGTLSIILTERSAHLKKHAGQIALPGGKLEAGETPVAAALREAEEEIALPPRTVEVLGTTVPYLTRTGFLVVPVLGFLRAGATLHPNPGEVAAVFTAPFRHVMTLQNHREITFQSGGATRTVHEVMVGERRVWGVTAGILRLVHEKLYAP